MKKTALVTGGNRGIGQQVCRELASAGWRVLVGARDSKKGEPAIARLRKDTRGDLREERLDVASPESIAACAGRLAERKVRLDALVNNAGVYGEARGAAGARRTIDVNFLGPLRITKALSPLLAPGANVVMVSSGIGELSNLPAPRRKQLLDPGLSLESLESLMEDFASGGEGWPRDAYAVSKAGLNALTRLFACELASRGIHVVSVCPGWVRTDMGGRNAPRTVEEGAAGVVWAASLGENGPTGGFFRDSQPIPW